MTTKEIKASVQNEKIRRTLKALEQNNMTGFYAETAEKAAEIAMGLVSQGETISCGGSMSLAESGIFAKMQSGDYNFLDRSVAGLTAEEIGDIYRKAFFADAFFTSANAVTENGELYNVDGNANRVAAIAFGPKKVIVVVGANKIVRDLDEAQRRVKCLAAPCNALRLHPDTPCEKLGKCLAADGKMTEGCRSPGRMCCQYLITAFQRQKGRINVIICPDELGY
ncbi:MAG: lactate utilization protein [Oscillospiraceae bacterium]